MFNIMLVEDVRAARLLVRRTLERRANLQVVAECDTAAGALQACQRYMPDIIFLDLKLPDQDGVHLLGPLRNLHPTVRIVVLTSDYESERALLAAGAQAYLTKPVDTERLMDVVDEVLAMPADELAKASATRNNGQHRQRVLLVDDDQGTRRLLSAMVYRLGGVVVGEATRLADIERSIHVSRPELCLLDVELDEGSSLAWLGAHPEIQLPPTVIVSSHCERRVVEAAMRVGAGAFVLKPVEPSKLAEAMARATKVA